MIRSMTGFGRGQARGTPGTIMTELRSVNHRFLEIVPHLPVALQIYDERVREFLRQHVRRGRVTCAVTVRFSVARSAQLHVNLAAARQYHGQLVRLGRRLRLPGTVTLDQLLALPRVLVVEDTTQAHAWWPLLEQSLRQAAERLNRTRIREGRATAHDVLRHVRQLERALEAVTLRAPRVVNDRRARLERRLQDVAPEVRVDPQRLAAEVALFAANADIAEELARLRSHLQQFRRAVLASGEQGRSLDFLAQEMFREINTMGAKANDYAITTHVIAMKGALEKMREQVQNVE